MLSVPHYIIFYNNKGKQPEPQKLHATCKTLHDYAILIKQIRQYHTDHCSLEDAVNQAVAYCFQHNLLADFLRKHHSEVSDIILTSYDEKAHMECIREEKEEKTMKNNLLSKDSRKLSNFFKGIAIILIFLTHSHLCFDLPAMSTVIQRFGQMGCQVFFVLSSFGLCHTFYNKPQKWLSHMKKRLLKLSIGYWCAIILYTICRLLKAILTQSDILSALNIPGIIINALFLHGLVPISSINNNIARGGWYIGTLVILYGIFPLLYKLYFTNKQKFWKKYRIIVFPLIIFLITTTIVITSELIHPIFACHNNSFIYFSFINQLTPFSLGIVLFDLSKHFCNKKLIFWGAILTLAISITLFFGNYKYSFVFCPSFVAIAFVFLYLYFFNTQNIFAIINNGSNFIIRKVCDWGKLSFSIYLTHMYIVYEFSLLCLKLLRPICDNDLLWYIILLPIAFCLSYVIGYLYNKCVSFIKQHIFHF